MKQGAAIIRTLAYHDIFDYPLKKAEILSLLIGKKESEKNISQDLANLVKNKKINTRKGFYFLTGREKIAAVRKQREKNSADKIKKARLYAQLLKLIPTLKLVGISGALSMRNCKKKDDIDFFIISSANSIWTTRFLANVLLFPFKRKPGSKKEANRACLNLFLDTSGLKIAENNLYTAHEICQMEPLWDKGETYRKFIKKNEWVFEYLPNWQPNQIKSKKSQSRGAPNKFQISFIEKLLKKLQLAYMRNKITTEKIGESQLFFHPKETQKIILAQYQKKLKKLKA